MWEFNQHRGYRNSLKSPTATTPYAGLNPDGLKSQLQKKKGRSAKRKDKKNLQVFKNEKHKERLQRRFFKVFLTLLLFHSAEVVCIFLPPSFPHQQMRPKDEQRHLREQAQPACILDSIQLCRRSSEKLNVPPTGLPTQHRARPSNIQWASSGGH